VFSGLKVIEDVEHVQGCNSYFVQITCKC